MIAVVRLLPGVDGTAADHEALGSDMDLLAAAALAIHHSVSLPNETIAVWKPDASGPALVARAGRAFTVGERGALSEIPTVELAPRVRQ